MKSRRFDFNWKPLQLQVSFVVDGSVSDRQNYNADTQEYTPDYTLTPLILQPCVSILDKDEVLAPGRVNHALTNIRWYEIISGNRQLISGDNPSYELTTTGGLAGRLKIKKNAEPKVPITLEFYAEYIDARTGQVSVIRGTFQLICSSASDVVRVELDAADQTIYNPLTDNRDQTITATVWVGDKICPAERYALVWEVMGGTAWRTAGSDAVLDSDIIAQSGNSITINRQLMGAGKYLRCRAKYSAAGDPGSVELSDATPSAEVSLVRRIPKFEYEIEGTPYNIPAGILSIAPTALIRNTNGEIRNAENELLPLWYIATNKASGSLSYTQVGHGKAPIIPTAKMDRTHGGVIGLEVKDRGPLAIMKDNDGVPFVDADGALLLIH